MKIRNFSEQNSQQSGCGAPTESSSANYFRTSLQQHTGRSVLTGEVGAGAKSGILAGLVWGVISALGLYGVMQIFPEAWNAQLESRFPPGAFSEEFLVFLPNFVIVILFVLGVAFGPVLGMIFSAIHDKYLRSRSIELRGILFSLALWLVYDVFDGLSSLPFGLYYYLAGIIGGLLANLVFGFLMGNLYQRFSRVPLPAKV